MGEFEAAIKAANIRGAPPRREDRRTMEAIIWPIDNRAKWRSIPAELGDWHHTELDKNAALICARKFSARCRASGLG